MTLPVIEAQDVTVEYGGRRRYFGLGASPSIQAVSEVSLAVQLGETVAVVGESGCGKSTLGRALLRSTPIKSGAIRFRGEDVSRLEGEALRRLRRRFQMIFQDPYASLNPKMTIFETLAEPLMVHTDESKAAIRDRVVEMLEAAGLDRSFAPRHPYEFSGGQRQRVAIARAAILRPDFIVADEPLSALDVSLQLQILQLFRRLKEQFNLTYLFISHDLARVFGFADRVLVMYLGKVVETGSAREIFHRPAHPYTQALIAAAPSARPGKAAPPPLVTGDIPSPLNPPKGCRFHTRCPLAMPICSTVEPAPRPLGGGHAAACHLVGEGAAASRPASAPCR